MKISFIRGCFLMIMLAPSRAVFACESVGGEFVMTKDSCKGYYSTLIPLFGQIGWKTLQAGDSVRIAQDSCDSVIISTSLDGNVSTQDFSPGVRVSRTDPYYTASVSRPSSGHLTFRDSEREFGGDAKRTVIFSVNKDKNLVIDLHSVTRSIVFGKAEVKSICTLNRM